MAGAKIIHFDNIIYGKCTYINLALQVTCRYLAIATAVGKILGVSIRRFAPQVLRTTVVP